MIEALDLGNRIAELLSGASECPTIDALPEVVQIPVGELFGFAFDLLAELEVRDQHYATIYAAAPAHVCPFCGTEYFDAPGAVREPLDHYLKKSQYAFAAVNLRNLVPMGHKCNSGYKGASDLLRRDDGSRRVAFDPYNHGAVRVSLDASQALRWRRCQYSEMDDSGSNLLRPKGSRRGTTSFQCEIAIVAITSIVRSPAG